MSNLIINNLSCIRGYNQLFTDLSFELRPGEILKISGTNGTGKTSLLKIIAGLNSAESGSIFFKNNDIDYMNSNKQKQKDNMYSKIKSYKLKSSKYKIPKEIEPFMKIKDDKELRGSIDRYIESKFSAN